ncbi:MAG: hypothetical protein IKQ69_10505 [Oscillospiraceae bacterium]|nr:hypothetical protein [Oscillospiraceae bacterium]
MRKNSIRRLGAALLALALLAGCGRQALPDGGSVSTLAPAPTDTPAPQATAVPAPTATPERESAAVDLPVQPEWTSADGIHADVDFGDMQWFLYDLGPFEDRAEELSRAEDEEAAETLYRWLLTEYTRLQTLDELAWIDFYYYGGEECSDRCQTTDEMLSTAGDTLHLAVSRVLNGPLGESFAAWLGEEDSYMLSDYQEMSDRELELSLRETELTLEYNDLLMDENLSQARLGLEAADIFLELVAVRNELAELRGYASYADYAYQAIYGRDYTPEDAAALCDALRPYARLYYRDCCYCKAFYVKLGREAEKSPEQLMELLREYAPRVSPRAAAAQAYMEEHGLFLLGSRGDIADLGFTTTLEYYRAPFLYNCLSGDLYDIGSMFHEFGHYYDAFVNPSPNPLTSGGSYDIFEIHSTGLEALSYFWYDELFDTIAEEARIYCLDGLIYNIISGCEYDEFQRYAYSHPELTAEELCDAYVSIHESYGGTVWDEEDRYYWVNVSHNFESPFYYISYAASALAAAQIWSLAREDFDAALDLYNRLVALGAYDTPYCQLLLETGLSVFTDGLDACLSDALESLQNMCLQYDESRPHSYKVK